MSTTQQIALETIQRLLTNKLPNDASNPFLDSAATMSAEEIQLRWDAQNAAILKIIDDAGIRDPYAA